MLEGRSCLVSRALRSSCEQETKWAYMSYHQSIDVSSKGKRRLEEETEGGGGGGDGRRTSFRRRFSDDRGESGSSSHSISPPVDGSSAMAGGSDQTDSISLIQPLGRDISLNCLIRCSRSDYGALASLNRSFRNLIKSGELYKLRRQAGISEQWVYFSCDVHEWEAFDPNRRRWMHLPPMPPNPNQCFIFSDKESLAVGTELLVFGMGVDSHVVLRYSILTNSWSPGTSMNVPRCLFGSASLGEIAILAGGCNAQGPLSTAELYNSEKQTWETLPNMNKPRKMCSGVFMDGKFYVIGGNVSSAESYTCGEEYNLQSKTWRVIPNMSPVQNRVTEAPPLVAVVNNELYAADYSEKELKKYDKYRNVWITLGSLPERALSTRRNGWGLAFKACGERLVLIGGPQGVGEGLTELNSWVPNDGPPQWDLLASKHSSSFVYNCAVMDC